MEKTKYINPEEAANLINPEYTKSSKRSSLYAHEKLGNLKPVFPELAIVENGKIIQLIGKSKKRFFLRSEVEDYANSKEDSEGAYYRVNFVATLEDGTEKKFKSILSASKELGIKYHVLNRAIHSQKTIQGYTFKKL